MKVPRIRRRDGISRFVLVALAVSLCIPMVTHAQQAQKSVQNNSAPVQTPQDPNSATEPYSSSLAALDSLSQNDSAAMSPAKDAAQSQSDQSGTATENQPVPQKPVGAAAAPPEGAAGVTAARPAGAVIAPAKQRRVRAILIRVGLLVGAGVALGTVMALSHATPSQPQ
jgi:cytoskeletal protein RodZ